MPNISVTKLSVIAFTSGAVVMSMELCGTRLAAPYLGSSLYVWTSIIGVILAALSIGYCLGGYLGDTKPELLSKLLVMASASLLLLECSETFVLNMVRRSNLDIRFAALLSATLLFAIPSILLGCITPFVTRLAITSLNSSGSVIGRLYAISTFGSIAGTFFTGFYLFSLVGSSQLLLFLALVVSLLPLLITFRQSIVSVIMLWILLGFMQYSHWAKVEKGKLLGILSLDTQYHRILLYDEKQKDGRVKRSLITDPFGAQSVMYLDSPQSLSGEYSQFYDIGIHSTKANGNFLLLGGGGYSYPKHFSRSFPKAKLDVVEIDSELINIAKKYFAYQDKRNLKVFHQDARLFLSSSNSKYHAIFLDVFNSAPEIPFHLATKEFFALTSERLLPNGFLVMNVIASAKGDGSSFLLPLVETMKISFSNVDTYLLGNHQDPEKVRNILLVAHNGRGLNWDEQPTKLKALALTKASIDSSSAQILSDEYAPVEALMLPVYNAIESQPVS